MLAPNWRGRPITDARRALDNANYPHRQWLAQQLLAETSGKAAARVLEVGCSYGPNLVCFHRQAPASMLYGLDISPANIDVGLRFSRDQGVPSDAITLTVGDMRHRLPFPTASFDIVFTDATLMYATPLQVRRVLAEVVRVSRSTVGTLELTGKARHFPHWRNRDGWIHNYAALLGRIKGVTQSIHRPLPTGIRDAGRWQSLGALTLARVTATPPQLVPDDTS